MGEEHGCIQWENTMQQDVRVRQMLELIIRVQFLYCGSLAGKKVVCKLEQLKQDIEAWSAVLCSFLATWTFLA